MISKYFSIYSIIFLGLIARIIITIFYADIGIDNEWRVMLINLYENGICLPSGCNLKQEDQSLISLGIINYLKNENI